MKTKTLNIFLLVFFVVCSLCPLSLETVTKKSQPTCLSPRIKNNFEESQISEQKFLRLRNIFQTTRSPEDLQNFLEAINPMLQWALFNGFFLDFALTEKRPQKISKRYLAPYVATDKLILDFIGFEIKDGNKEAAKDAFFKRYGHTNFKEVAYVSQPEGIYQTGVMQQTVYPFCCGTSSRIVENLLLNIEGLLVFRLNFVSSYDKKSRPFVADLHYATLVIDVFSSTAYYISLSDGQFVEAKKADGTTLTQVFNGYLPTKDPNGFLGTTPYPVNFVNPDYILWYFSNGHDKVAFKKLSFCPDSFEPDSVQIKNFIHNQGLLPKQLNQMTATEVFDSSFLDDRKELMAFLPDWLSKRIDSKTTKLYLLELSA